MQIHYIIFTHLAKGAWGPLEEHAELVADRLTKSPQPGIIVGFFDEGWISLLNSIGTDFDPVRMTDEFTHIKEREAKIRHLKLGDCFRLVTAKTLAPIINNLRGNKPGLAAAQLRRYLVGDDPGVRYDTTKVVEAIIRIRQLGTGVPVIRLDWDVLFDEDTPNNHLPPLIGEITDRYERYNKDARIYSFLMSAGYKPGPPKHSKWSINDFNTAFATRMFPALIPSSQVCDRLNRDIVVDANRQRKDGELDEGQLTDLSELGLLDTEVMLSYYGLQSDQSILGSQPLDSVISGAGLVLSDGAILDLPPFSNFQTNVMWIDDHLKFEVHRGLGHLTDTDRHGHSVAGRLENLSVVKNRVLAGQGNLRLYTLEVYIPTLFWGLVLDGWISGVNASSASKPTPSAFVKALEKALARGIFESSDRAKLTADLRSSAAVRAEDVRQQWSKLASTAGDKSFAALWVAGNSSSIKGILSGLSQPKDESYAWGLLEDGATNPIDQSTLRPMRPSIVHTIEQLAADLCTYIDWTLEWPKFIQSVRAVRHGSLSTDVRRGP